MRNLVIKLPSRSIYMPIRANSELDIDLHQSFVKKQKKKKKGHQSETQPLNCTPQLSYATEQFLLVMNNIIPYVK